MTGEGMVKDHDLHKALNTVAGQLHDIRNLGTSMGFNPEDMGMAVLMDHEMGPQCVLMLNPGEGFMDQNIGYSVQLVLWQTLQILPRPHTMLSLQQIMNIVGFNLTSVLNAGVWRPPECRVGYAACRFDGPLRISLHDDAQWRKLRTTQFDTMLHEVEEHTKNSLRAGSFDWISRATTIEMQGKTRGLN